MVLGFCDIKGGEEGDCCEESREVSCRGGYDVNDYIAWLNSFI